MNKLSIYNLEFPSYVNEIDVAGYKFKRIADYEKSFAGLQHIIDAYGDEFERKNNTGTHQKTAEVEIPKKENPPILPWGYKAKRLDDVLLFLTLFTGRNVFALKPGEEKHAITQDPRMHRNGGEFRLSTLEYTRWRNKKTGELLSEQEMTKISKGRPMLQFDYDLISLRLEKTVNQVLATISSAGWKKEYGEGYFIFLFRQAMRQEDIEPAFLLCWTIWEHLFTLHNQSWLDDASIEQTSGDKKISFILNKYLLVKIDGPARKEIQRITKARNRLVHFGKIPNNVDLEEMRMFIRLTEQIMAITLKLKPSNVFNSFEQLNKFLKKPER